MSRRILAIDPGNEQSAYVIIDADTCRPLEHGKVRNEDLRDWVLGTSDTRHALACIEMVASYGMPVGREVFETCVWIGRFAEILAQRTGLEPTLVYRRDVKLHHCHSPRANDATIRQALVDRFAPGQPNHGKGTAKRPGWFHGFKADIWQAYALAVHVADKQAGRWG
ncbi:MAG: hypothetical protein Q4D79_00035 [Propionibacteriaceae bacterium]|nr:hypothetical protein [Propionibacteriaceae bacterium]